MIKKNKLLIKAILFPIWKACDTLWEVEYLLVLNFAVLPRKYQFLLLFSRRDIKSIKLRDTVSSPSLEILQKPSRHRWSWASWSKWLEQRSFQTSAILRYTQLPKFISPPDCWAALFKSWEATHLPAWQTANTADLIQLIWQTHWGDNTLS